MCLSLKASGGPSCYHLKAVWSLDNSQGLGPKLALHDRRRGGQWYRTSQKANYQPRWTTVPWPLPLAMPSHGIAGHPYSRKGPSAPSVAGWTAVHTRAHFPVFCSEQGGITRHFIPSAGLTPCPSSSSHGALGHLWVSLVHMDLWMFWFFQFMAVHGYTPLELDLHQITN